MAFWAKVLERLGIHFDDHCQQITCWSGIKKQTKKQGLKMVDDKGSTTSIWLAAPRPVSDWCVTCYKRQVTILQITRAPFKLYS